MAQKENFPQTRPSFIGSSYLCRRKKQT